MLKKFKTSKINLNTFAEMFTQKVWTKVRGEIRLKKGSKI